MWRLAAIKERVHKAGRISLSSPVVPLRLFFAYQPYWSLWLLSIVISEDPRGGARLENGLKGQLEAVLATERVFMYRNVLYTSGDHPIGRTK
jgi:hypothetical protein